MLRRSALLLLCALAIGLVLPGSAAATEDRYDELRQQVARTGIHLEPSPANGDVAGWTERLAEARDAVDLDAPVHVALWTPVPGVAPDPDGSDPFEQLGPDLEPGVWIVSHGHGIHVRVIGAEYEQLAGEVTDVTASARGVVEELSRHVPDTDRWWRVTDVARVWILLRLAGDSAPTAPELVEELKGDTSLFDDRARASQPGQDQEARSGSAPLAITLGVLVVLATIGIQLRMGVVERRERLAVAARPEPTPWAAELTTLVLNERLTGLAEAIAAATPGTTAYDLAQGCADAAGKYVDSGLARDLVGAQMLIEDGHAHLAGESPHERCFFNPRHDATTTVHRDEVRVPCCAACARCVSKGRLPDSLVVAGPDGRAAPYYETADVWTRTGYGAIDERYARRALLEALR